MSRGRPKNQQGIQSIEVGGRLLQVLARARQPQKLSDLAQAAHMPPAKAHRYLVSLMRIGIAEQQLETGLYDLGGFALELGLSALARLQSVQIAAPALAELSRETRQTVALAVWANHGPTMVRWLGADAPVQASLRVGSVMPLTRSATGGAFLAFMSPQITASRLRKELLDNARKGLKPDTPEAVKRTVKQTRRQGFANVPDFIPGIGGIAAPVFDYTGDMVLALVMLGYSKPFQAAMPKLATALLDQTRGISTRLGWHPARGQP